MSEYKPIDILQELTDLYAKEDLLGFFEFTLARPGNDPLSGLCKISKPKSGTGQPTYLSLTFVVDTPDDDARVRIADAIGKMAEGGFRRALPQVAEIVPLPSLSSGADSYVRQIDVLLAANIEPARSFVTERLAPAIRNVTQFTIGEMVWWDETAEPRATAPGSTEAETTLTSRVRKYLMTRWGGTKK